MEESFAAFYEPVKNSSESLWTSISQYRSSSECAYAHHRVPFKLVNLVWYQASSWAVAPTSYTLVGITSTWNVVVLGDNLGPQPVSGSTAREILGEPHVQQRRTLFQDIFGKSAFDEPKKYVSNSDPSDFPQGRASKDVSALFAGPAYLLPNLEALFEPAMSSFLKSRCVEETGDVRVQTAENFPDEDVDMGQPAPISTTAVPWRVVDAQPMDLLVELFRTTTVDCDYLCCCLRICC
jgi:NET1-associated nuclear protein 1 (U3 small nucleolar RNA-associated protein 17)